MVCIAVGIVGPANQDGSVNQWVKVIEAGEGAREENMWEFTKRSLQLLEKCMTEYNQKNGLQRSRV